LVNANIKANSSFCIFQFHVLVQAIPQACFRLGIIY